MSITHMGDIYSLAILQGSKSSAAYLTACDCSLYVGYRVRPAVIG